ncbi:hypothetical protein C8J57DRAFT_1524177 [Mycena rebaudengoi]|nr:hypothetical protein C8J57DRAFT_1524177 [Mycena rebaudengoi]
MCATRSTGGPVTFLNAVAKTYGWWTQRRGRYDVGVEEFMRMVIHFIPCRRTFLSPPACLRRFRLPSPSSLSSTLLHNDQRPDVDSRLHHMFELKLNKPIWERGDFSYVVQNRTEKNPWVNGTKAAPFDHCAWFLLLSSHGTVYYKNNIDYIPRSLPPDPKRRGGWFPDRPEKAWSDRSATAPRDFLQEHRCPSWPRDIELRALVMCVLSYYSLRGCLQCCLSNAPRHFQRLVLDLPSKAQETFEG